jgi:hypothetical protein
MIKYLPDYNIGSYNIVKALLPGIAYYHIRVLF